MITDPDIGWEIHPGDLLSGSEQLTYVGVVVAEDGPGPVDAVRRVTSSKRAGTTFRRQPGGASCTTSIPSPWSSRRQLRIWPPTAGCPQPGGTAGPAGSAPHTGPGP